MRLDDDGEEKAEEDGYVEAFKGVAIKVNGGSAAAPCTSVKELPWFPSFSFLGFIVPPFPSFLPGVLHCGGETYQMQQLSGGQKTIVALALIFAIQVGLSWIFAKLLPCHTFTGAAAEWNACSALIQPHFTCLMKLMLTLMPPTDQGWRIWCGVKQILP